MATARRIIPMLLLTAIALAACGGGTPEGAVQPTQSSLLAADECRAAELAMATAAGGGSTATGTTPSPDQAIATLRRIAADAAAGIKADIELVAGALQKYFKALADAGVDLSDPSTIQNDPEAAQAVGRAATEFQVSGATAAVARIRGYLDQICPSAD